MKQIKESGKAEGQQANPAEEMPAAPAPEPSPIEVPASVKKNRRRRLIKRITAGVVAVAVVAGVVVWKGRKKDEGGNDMAGYVNAQVERRTITEELSGNGTLSPAESYVMTTLVSGDIVEAPFEEGDVVEKGTKLYQVDNSTVSHSIEQSQLSLEKSQRDYNQALDKKKDLNIKATRGGSVVSIHVKKGDTVAAGQEIATIRNSAVMSLTLPFNASDADNFYVGQEAAVTLEGSFETLHGTISTVGASEVLGGGMPVRQITIDVQNPGAIAPEQTATAMVGGVACNGSGKFAYSDEVKVTAAIGGDVSQINVSEGDTVAEGQVLVVLYSKELDNSIQSSAEAVRSAQLSLEGQVDQMGDYVITSPISGTIIEKNYKAGDKLEVGKQLCTVFDLSYLKMTMNIDELDVGKVQVGQQVTVTADAAEGKTYTGTVTKININGTTNNGVTSYPVTVQIDEYDGLLPGMNVNARIVVQSKENVLAVPVGAVSRGNIVLVQSAAGTPDAKGEDEEDAEAPSAPGNAVAGVPAGFEYKQVELGITDKTYIEITSGLSEGETIAIMPDAGGATPDAGAMGGNVVIVG